MPPLVRQPVEVNFSQGLDSKTDPYQVAIGKFLELKNSVFDTGGLLKKRNGYGALAPISSDTSTFLSTFNGNLTAIGTSLQAYNQASKTWVNKGSLQPVDVSVLSLIRSNTNQTQADTAISGNGLVCTVFTDNVPSNGVNVAAYKYAVADATTGQNIIAPTAIPVSSGTVTGSPRVFLLGNYFVIVITNNVSGTYHLQYTTVNINSPAAAASAVDFSTAYTPASTVAFDGVVANNRLFLAWNGNDGGGAIRMRSLTSTLVASSVKTFAGYVSTLMSVTADTSQSSPVIYTSFYDAGASTGYTLAVDTSLNTVLAPTQWLSSSTVDNVTSTATGNVCTVFYEVDNAYTFDGAIKTNYISKKTVSVTGTVSSAAVVARSVGLASKAFLIDTTPYMLSVQSSTFQPTIFLINGSGQVIARIAYQNSGGYITTGLPSVSLSGTIAKVPYLFKDLVQAVNKSQGVSNAAGVYSQTGINLGIFDIGTSTKTSAEIASNLHLTGGFLWDYDGYVPVENNFFLYPENLEAVASTGGGSMSPQQYFYVGTYEWSDNQGNLNRSAPSVPISITPVAAAVHTFANTDVNTTNNTATITAHGYSTGTAVVLTTSGGLPAPLALATTYYLIRVDANTVKFATSYANALAGTAIDITTQGTGTDTVTPASNQNSVVVNFPTLRLTYKIANPVKLVVYRWSTAQQTYYQTTSITIPTLNDPTVDSIAITDSNSDAQILGNNILYTTGGVLEDLASPPVATVTLWQDRLVLLDAEDRNTLWYSKTILAGTPIELNDGETLYVAPTIGSQGSTGPIKTLSAMDDKLIVFKENAIYYFTGQGPDNTGNNNNIGDPVFITATVGCSNQSSIVFIPSGLMFQSDKGIWLLGRDLSTSYIGAPVEGFTQGATVLSAISVPGTNQVRFTLDTGITLMYDYYFQQWGTFVNVPAVSSTLYQNLHTYLDSFGAVYQETPGHYLDGSNPVLMSFTTSWIKLAGLQAFQRAYEMYFLGTYITPHTLNVSVGYDYGPNSQSSTYFPDNYTPNWGGEQLWGSAGPWGGNGNLEDGRLYFNTQQCKSIQISVQELFDPSFGTVAGAGLTMSGMNFVIGVSKAWPRTKASKSFG